MPKQIGEYKLIGTIDNLTFYKMDGEYLVRMKTSLDKKRVSTDPAFAGSYAAALRFGAASRIASRVYRALPKELKIHGFQGKLTGLGIAILKEGKTEAETLAILTQFLPGISGFSARGSVV